LEQRRRLTENKIKINWILVFSKYYALTFRFIRFIGTKNKIYEEKKKKDKY